MKRLALLPLLLAGCIQATAPTPELHLPTRALPRRPEALSARPTVPTLEWAQAVPQSDTLRFTIKADPAGELFGIDPGFWSVTIRGCMPNGGGFYVAPFLDYDGKTAQLNGGQGSVPFVVEPSGLIHCQVGLADPGEVAWTVYLYAQDVRHVVSISGGPAEHGSQRGTFDYDSPGPDCFPIVLRDGLVTSMRGSHGTNSP